MSPRPSRVPDGRARRPDRTTATVGGHGGIPNRVPNGTATEVRWAGR